MQRPKCLKPETLLEFVSLPEEMGRLQVLKIRWHLRSCEPCQAVEAQVRTQCARYFHPEPEITSSLLRVYSRLQRDETLILKGWKLDEPRSVKTAQHALLREGWLFRGGLALASLIMVGVVAFSSTQNEEGEKVAVRRNENRPPLAQIRIEQPGRVKVHYVEPELLQTMEFETTSARY